MPVDYPEPPYPSQKNRCRDRRRRGPSSGSRRDQPQGAGRPWHKAVITGGDSALGRAVAIAYPREDADVLIAYLSEHDDANEVKEQIEKEERKAVLIEGDIGDAAHCRSIIGRAIEGLGGVDIRVNIVRIDR
jgi:hypothetical protein